MDSQLCIFTLFLWNLGYSESHRTYFFVLFLFPFLCSSCNITLIISTVKRWVLIILWRFCEPRFCERYEPCTFTWKALFQACLVKRAFSWKCIGRQPDSEGIYSRAVHGVISQLHSDFLDLTTFLRQIFGKNIFVWFSYHIVRQRLLVYTTAGTVSGRFILDISFSTWDFSAIWL